MILALLVLSTVVAPGKVQRIDLVNSARVVRYDGTSPETLQVHSLERGLDGWDAWLGPDGQYMIGVEWDEPRDLAEVNVEFRHAIANREQIKVQYWQEQWPNAEEGGWGKIDDAFHGKWATAKAEWWAGDRDLSFSFVPYNQEQPGEHAPDVRYRRTYRLRFLLGKGELPPVRYLHAYGPNKAAEAVFDLAFDAKSTLRPPLKVSVVNGDVVEDEDGKPTATQSTQLESGEKSLTIRYATGDVVTPTRTVVTLRDAVRTETGISFLPAEVAKSGKVAIPAFGVTIGLHGAAPASQPVSQPTYYDRIPRQPEQTWEQARREIPALQKTKQKGRPMYLPLGPPAGRQEIAVNYDGSIYVNKTALKVPAADSERLKWSAEAWYLRIRTGEPPFDISAEGVVKQRLLDGYLPIVINSWENGGLTYEQTCVATYLNGEPADPRGDEPVVLLARIVVKNTTSRDATARVLLEPDPPEALGWSTNGHVLAQGRLKSGLLDRRYGESKYRFYMHPAPKDPPTLHEPSKDTARFVIQDGKPFPVEWGGVIAPQGSAQMVVVVPFVTPATASGSEEPDEWKSLAALDFDRVLQAESERWRQIIAQQAQIEVPNPLLNDFYKANLSHILITADRDPFNGTWVLPAATYNYGPCLNESCHQIRSLDMRGLHKEAQKYLDAIVAGQSSVGLHGRFTDKNGAFQGLPSKNGSYQEGEYNLDHGFALWMLAEHYKFTRDRAWLEKVSEAMIKGCDFITRQRARSMTQPESDTLAKDDMFWGQGLLPPGHLEDPPEWHWWFAVNAYACRGMQATADVLRDIHHAEAERIAVDAEEFSAHLRRSCQEAMIRSPAMRHSDGTWWPFQPTRSRLRGREFGWIRDALYGPIHLIDCGVYPAVSREADWILRDAEDNVFLSDERGRHLDSPDHWFSWGGITIQSNLIPSPLVYLQRGQPQYAIRAFWNSLGANVYEDVRTFCEHPVDAYGVGQGPFFKSPDESAFIVWFRSLLILENGADLDLLAGVPQAWLEPGKKIHVKAAATWFGPMDVDVESSANELTVKLSAPVRNKAHEIRLHNRRVGRIQSVMIDNQPTSAFDSTKAVLAFPGKSGVVTIVFKY